MTHRRSGHVSSGKAMASPWLFAGMWNFAVSAERLFLCHMTASASSHDGQHQIALPGMDVTRYRNSRSGYVTQKNPFIECRQDTEASKGPRSFYGFFGAHMDASANRRVPR